MHMRAHTHTHIQMHMYTHTILQSDVFDSNQSLVHFRIGDKVPVGKKGRYGVVRGEAEALFSPYHLFVESSNAEDFNDDRVLQQVLH